MSTANILVFDSGLGGLSVVKAIRDRLPNCVITYLADNALFPYGSMEDATLKQRVTLLLRAAIPKYQPDIIVIACNTASTLVLDNLRQLTNIPVVGVVPAIKPAAQLTKTGHIGLLATTGTVQRAYTNKLIEEFASHVQVHRIGSEALVKLAENVSTPEEQCHAIITQELSPWLTSQLAQQIDVVVLACTHFPLLNQLIQNTLPTTILMDSGSAIARRVEQLLSNINIEQKQQDDVAVFTLLKNINTEKQAFLSQFSLNRTVEFTDEYAPL